MERKIYYESTDNIKLCGLLNTVNNDKKIVILCHGFYSNKYSTGFNKLVKKLQSLNINSFRFDFRGLGESSGQFVETTPLKELADLESTIEYVISLGYQDIVLLGTSFGGSIVSQLEYKKYPSIKALVLWYSVLDYQEFAKTNEELSKEKKEIADKQGYYEKTNSKGTIFKIGKDFYNEVCSLVPYKNIINLDLPILFVHGLKDTIVPYESSVKISKMCKRPQLELIKNGNHSFTNNKKAMNEAINVTTKYIKNILNRKKIKGVVALWKRLKSNRKN